MIGVQGTLKSDFAASLRALRSHAGLTQQELADFAMLSVRAVRDMEAGRVRRPRQESVRLLADALRLDERKRADLRVAAGHHTQPAEPEPVPPPAPLNMIIGREAEVEALTEAFAAHGQRLMTLSGLSGVGKTRLALEVAWQLHATRGWSVLWSAAEPGGRLDELVRDPGCRAEEIAELVDNRDTLLVIDGADGELAGPALMELLHRRPRLRLLITALLPREIKGEQVVPVAPLPVPEPSHDDDLAHLAKVSAVRLFVSHIRRLRPEFRLSTAEAAPVARLCRRLDGLPRALELAASACLVFSPRQMLDWPALGPLDMTSPGGQEGLREGVLRTLAALRSRPRSLLVQLSRLEHSWSLDDAASHANRPVHELFGDIHTLRSSGTIRRDGERFTVLNLVRISMHGYPVPMSRIPAA